MPMRLAMMLQGSVVIPGQAVAVDWLNRPQLVVAVVVSTGGSVGPDDDPGGCASAAAVSIVDESTVHFFPLTVKLMLPCRN